MPTPEPEIQETYVRGQISETVLLPAVQNAMVLFEKLTVFSGIPEKKFFLSAAYMLTEIFVLTDRKLITPSYTNTT